MPLCVKKIQSEACIGAGMVIYQSLNEVLPSRTCFTIKAHAYLIGPLKKRHFPFHYLSLLAKNSREKITKSFLKNSPNFANAQG